MSKNNKKIIITAVIIILAICLCIGIMLMIKGKPEDNPLENKRTYDGTTKIGTPEEFTINTVQLPEKVGSGKKFEIGDNSWYYDLDSEGNAINVYVCGNFTGEVILPSELDGHKVISIGDDLSISGSTLFDTSINGEKYWKNITSITVPDGVKYINSHAFEECENLKKVTLPDSIVYIGNSAFSYCKNLSSINSEIEGKIIMPKNLQYYGTSLFRGNKKMNSFEFPKQIDYIQNYTFYETTGFSDVVIEKQFKYIGRGAFFSSTIESLTIENGVKIIETEAFAMNKELKKVTIADSVIHIGGQAFMLCRHLDEFKYNGKLDYIGVEVFDYTNVKDCLKSNQLPNI